MFNVEANLNLYALAGTAGVVNGIANLDEVVATDSFKAPITLLGGTATVLYTAPAGGPGLVKNVVLVNTSNTQVGGIKLFKGSSAITATQISGTIVIAANGMYVYTGETMQPYDGTGAPTTGAATATAKNYSARVFARQTWR